MPPKPQSKKRKANDVLENAESSSTAEKKGSKRKKPVETPLARDTKSMKAIGSRLRAYDNLLEAIERQKQSITRFKLQKRKYESMIVQLNHKKTTHHHKIEEIQAKVHAMRQLVHERQQPAHPANPANPSVPQKPKTDDTNTRIGVVQGERHKVIQSTSASVDATVLGSTIQPRLQQEIATTQRNFSFAAYLQRCGGPFLRNAISNGDLVVHGVGDYRTTKIYEYSLLNRLGRNATFQIQRTTRRTVVAACCFDPAAKNWRPLFRFKDSFNCTKVLPTLTIFTDTCIALRNFLNVPNDGSVLTREILFGCLPRKYKCLVMKCLEQGFAHLAKTAQLVRLSESWCAPHFCFQYGPHVEIQARHNTKRHDLPQFSMVLVPGDRYHMYRRWSKSEGGREALQIPDLHRIVESYVGETQV